MERLWDPWFGTGSEKVLRGVRAARSALSLTGLKQDTGGRASRAAGEAAGCGMALGVWLTASPDAMGYEGPTA
ncbi:MAG TPA: hypothetical protein VFS39_12650 [Nitrospira sp.]|nr:hypothetical protein [Nitrospira sp.]